MNAERAAGAQEWMVNYMADLLDIPPAQVDVNRSFDSFGLDSTATVAFTSDLGRWLGTKLDTKLMVQYESIKAVADHLAQAGMARA